MKIFKVSRVKLTIRREWIAKIINTTIFACLCHKEMQQTPNLVVKKIETEAP